MGTVGWLEIMLKYVSLFQPSLMIFLKQLLQVGIRKHTSTRVELCFIHPGQATTTYHISGFWTNYNAAFLDHSYGDCFCGIEQMH